jgi:hypothetical protein
LGLLLVIKQQMLIIQISFGQGAGKGATVAQNSNFFGQSVKRLINATHQISLV